MAVYYKWIKGCAPGASLDSGTWSYLKWGVSNDGGVNSLPRIYTSNGKKDNSATEETDLGYVLTNNATGIEVKQNWTFKGTNTFSEGNTFQKSNTHKKRDIFNEGVELNNSILFKVASGSKKHHIIEADEKNTPIKIVAPIWLGVDKNYQGNPTNNTNPYACAYISQWDNSKEAEGTEPAKGKIETFVETRIGLSSGNATAIFPKYSSSAESIIKTKLTVEKECDALFFNATSDIRAKENIVPSTYAALELIKNLQIYNFNYKDNKDTVTGILAQDLLEKQPRELNLVSNVNATGENNDYMSIKNDKLIFVLMKAIQEQQDIIESLKEEINQLKK